MRGLWALALLAAPLGALGQSSYLTITTNNANEITAGAGGAGMRQGSFCAYATDARDQPIAFEIASVQQAAKGLACVQVVNGQFAGTLELANPAVTTPPNIRYHVSITDTNSGIVTQYPLVSIVVANSVTTWDWASWNPSGGVTLPPFTGLDSDVTAQTASQTVTVVASVPASGKYRISYVASQNAVCASGSVPVFFTFSWNDGTTAHTATTIALTLGSSRPAGTSSIQGVIPIDAAASSAITYTSTVVGSCATGGPASYDAHITVEGVQ
jgi:hypothetical protein